MHGLPESFNFFLIWTRKKSWINFFRRHFCLLIEQRRFKGSLISWMSCKAFLEPFTTCSYSFKYLHFVLMSVCSMTELKQFQGFVLSFSRFNYQQKRLRLSLRFLTQLYLLTQLPSLLNAFPKTASDLMERSHVKRSSLICTTLKSFQCLIVEFYGAEDESNFAHLHYNFFSLHHWQRQKL